MPKVGGRRKKARTHQEAPDVEETSTGQRIPKTFILKRGAIPNPLKTIIGDMREVMYPHTAMKLRESAKNKLKDFLSTGSGFGVNHMILFSSTERNNYLRLVKMPDGPTLTFKINKYSSHKDIVSSQKKPRIFGRTLAAPLLILNGFNNVDEGDDEENRPTAKHYNLVHLMIQNMFAPLDLAKAKIYNTKKAVLFTLDPDTDLIEFRYYGIKVHQAGVNKNIKQLLEAKKLPNLKNFKDISEYILKENDYMSENEIEDTLEEETKSKSGKSASNKMTVKLYEIGPRLSLQLIKIEEGLLKGNVVYHRIVKKTAKEIEANRKKLKEKTKQKEELKKKQDEAINAKADKKAKKEELKKKREFLDEQQEDKEEGYGDGDDMYNKEMDEDAGFNDEEEEDNGEINVKRKRPFDLSKGKVDDEEEEEEEEEDDIGEDDEVEMEEDEGEYEDEEEVGDEGDDVLDDVDEY